MESPAQREQRLKRKRAWLARRTPTQKAADAAQQKAWRMRNPDRVRSNLQKWNREHQGWRRDYEKKYWAEHREARKRKVRKAYLKNRLPRIAQIKAYTAAHRERRRETQRVYDARSDRKVKRAACTKRWLRAHPEFTKSRNAKRKALIRGAGGGARHADAMVRRWKKRKNFICYYCQEKFPVKKLHIDHIVAISKGGGHTEENLCAACATCNLRKRAQPVTELTFVPQRLLAL